MTFIIHSDVKKAIAKDVPLHDILHGEVLNRVIEEQDIMTEMGDDEQGSANYEFHRGYSEALQAVYGFIYALVFEQEDQKRGASV